MQTIEKTELQYHIGSLFGHFGDTPTDIQCYSLGNLTESDIVKYAEAKGYKILEFTHEVKPDFNVYGYKQGYVWVYNPNQADNSFHDVDYTRKWRYIHELAHALTYDQILEDFNIRTIIRGKGLLSMKESVIALTWELHTLSKQWDVIKELGGVAVEIEERKREVLTVLYDGMCRCISGEFANPDLEGFVANIELLSEEDFIGSLIKTLPNLLFWTRLACREEW